MDIPRIGSGGPAGTFDQVEAARNTSLIGASVRVRVIQSIDIFCKERKKREALLRRVGWGEEAVKTSVKLLFDATATQRQRRPPGRPRSDPFTVKDKIR